MSSRLWANNLIEIDFLGLHGQVSVSSRGGIKRQRHEGSAQIAHDDRAFFCCVCHNDPQKTLIDKLKLSEKMKVQPQKTNKGITVVLEEGKILAVTAHETKFRLAAEFQKVLPSFTEFMQRIAHGLTVEEYTRKPAKSKLLDCASRYHADILDISLSGSDEDENTVAAVPCPSKSTVPESFRNPNCMLWPSDQRSPNSKQRKPALPGLSKSENLVLQEKKKPKPISYAARQVLAAQENNLQRDSVRAADTSSFYGTPAQDDDDFTGNAGRLWTPYGNRPFSCLDSFASRHQSSPSDSPHDTPKKKKTPSSDIFKPSRFQSIFGPRSDTSRDTPKKEKSQSPLSYKKENTSAIGLPFQQTTLDFSNSSHSGFSNLGNTCYMNSILQALLGLKSFADDLRDKDILEKLRKDRKLSLYRSLYNLLVAKEKGAQFQVRRDALRSVKSSLESAVQRYRGWRQQDAHEFLCLLLNLLDSEVSEVEKATTEQNDSLSDPKPSQGLCSPVTLNFVCDTRTTLTCQGCGRKHSSNEMFLTFPVSLPNSSVLSVQYMFNAFFEDYEVGHSCRCGHVKGTVSRCIVSLPRVLIIYLKRYKLVGNAYVKRTDKVRVPSSLALDHLCDANVKLPHVFVCKEDSRPSSAERLQHHSSSPAPSLSKSTSMAYSKSPTNDSTYGSGGNSPFLKMKTVSLSGEKRKRVNSGDSGVEVIDLRDEPRHAQKRLCLDETNTEEFTKQLTESNTGQDSLHQFSLSDDEEDEDLAKALSLSVAETKKDESDMSKAIVESLKEAESQNAKRTQLDEAVARSLMEHQSKKHYSEMTEEEQLRHALALSLKEVQEVQDVNCFDDFGDELISGNEREQKTGSEEHTYRLVSVVSHLGKNSSTGHYLCDVYNPSSKTWKSYNDSTVRDIEEHEVQRSRSDSGYIFFYMHRQIVSAID